MPHLLDTTEYLDTVCQLLADGQTQVTVPVTGGSMVPFLHSGDTAYLDPLPVTLKRGDIVLYRRANGDYVLHRICRIRSDGSFLIAGDAQQRLEILPDRSYLRGIVSAVRHGGKLLTPGSLRWQLYRHIWRWLLPLRHRLMALKKKSA